MLDRRDRTTPHFGMCVGGPLDGWIREGEGDRVCFQYYLGTPVPAGTLTPEQIGHAFYRWADNGWKFIAERVNPLALGIEPAEARA